MKMLGVVPHPHAITCIRNERIKMISLLISRNLILIHSSFHSYFNRIPNLIHGLIVFHMLPLFQKFIITFLFFM